MIVPILRHGNIQQIIQHNCYCYRRCSKKAKDLAEGIISHTKVIPELNDEKDVKKISSHIISTFPEAPTTCCMSGCANCVWLDYADKLSEYFHDGGEKSMKEIEKRVTDNNMKAYLMHEMRMRHKNIKK